MSTVLNLCVRSTQRVLVAVIVAVGLVFASTTVSETVPSAGAAAKMYVEKPCIIKAMTGPGTKGNGCNLYGTPKWISTAQRPPFPAWAWNALVNCISGGTVALAAIWFSGGGSMVVLALSCIAPAVAGQLTR